MTRTERVALLILCAIGCALPLSILYWDAHRPPPAPQATPHTSTAWEVFYSPHGGCTDALTHRISLAKNEILVLAYSFTSDPITEALLDARQRGVSVRVIVDKSQQHGVQVGRLVEGGIKVWIDAKHAIAHNKVMVFDQSIVATGSFNFTENAEDHNSENLLIVHDVDLAKRYCTEWVKHNGHSDAWRKP